MIRLVMYILCSITFVYSQNPWLHPDSNVTRIGVHPWGPCQVVFSDSDFVYLNNGGSIEILDYSDPVYPQKQSAPYTPYIAEDIFIKDDYMYIADRSPYIRIYDISNPKGPIALNSIEAGGQTFSVTVTDSLLHAGSYNAYTIMNIADPENPQTLAQLEMDGLLDINISEKHAFISDGSAGIKCIDITDPTQPQIVSSVKTMHWARHSVTKDGFLYVADSREGLQTYNVSDPDTLLHVDTDDTPGYAYQISIKDNYLYVADASAGGIQIFDISSPGNPAFVNAYNSLGSARQSTISGSYLFLADGEYGCQILDITNPTAPELIRRHTTGSNATGISVEGNYAFLAAGGEGYRIVDITIPTFPKHLRSFKSLGSASDLVVDNGLLYLADGGSGLSVFNVQAPTAYNYVGKLNLANTASRIDKHGNDLYITSLFSGITSLNVQNPSSPGINAVMDYLGNCKDVFIQENYAYVAENDTLIILDISDPKTPEVLTRFDNSGNNTAICVRGNYAYLATFGDGLTVVDISNTELPQEVGSISMGVTTVDMVIYGAVVYMACGADGFIAVDVSNPIKPKKVAWYDTPSYLYDVFVSPDYIFLADGGFGMFILESSIVTEIAEKSMIPQELHLAQNYPNPFNPITTIEYDVGAIQESFQHVTLSIYNLLGQNVATLVNERQAPGHYSVSFDGRGFASGLYYYILCTSSGLLESRKMVLVK